MEKYVLINDAIQDLSWKLAAESNIKIANGLRYTIQKLQKMSQTCDVVLKRGSSYVTFER
jgi:hypothetical protein